MVCVRICQQTHGINSATFVNTAAAHSSRLAILKQEICMQLDERGHFSRHKSTIFSHVYVYVSMLYAVYMNVIMGGRANANQQQMSCEASMRTNEIQMRLLLLPLSLLFVLVAQFVSQLRPVAWHDHTQTLIVHITISRVQHRNIC